MFLDKRFLIAAICLLGPLAAQGVATKAHSVQPRFFPSKATRHHHDASSTSSASVTNAGSYLDGVSPGGLATVFGQNLTDVSDIVYANSDPFPTTLANVQVTVNGLAAPIISIAYANGLDQISFQVPWETKTGLASAEVKVYDYGTIVADVVTDSYTEDPGVFEFQQYGLNYAIALHTSDYSLVTANNPAAPGEILILYVTGLGPVDQYVRDGFGAPSDPVANTIDPYRIVVAGEDARILFSGLAPGFVGLYQINLQLPGDLPAGDLSLRISSVYADSQTVALSVR